MFNWDFSFGGHEPTEPSSPGQLSVIAVVIIGILILVGGILIYLSFGQPPEKQELAEKAWYLGLISISAGCTLTAILYLIRRFLDY